MSATAERPRSRESRIKENRGSREQVASQVLEVLGAEPQSAAQIDRAVFPEHSGNGNAKASQVVRQALQVLVARGQAKQIPASDGQRGGWVDMDSPYEADLAMPLEIEFDYEFDKHLPLDQMFVDETYQRPLTTFANRIEKAFDPYLFQSVMVSDRGTKASPRYALIDGQTRWAAATRIGVQTAPAQVFKNLTPEDEASIFWRIQKNRAGMVSFYRFRAQLRSGDETSVAINQLAEDAGYRLGAGPGELRAVAALEKGYAQDPFSLERAMQTWHAAWPNHIPEGTHITGLVFFFRHFPITGRTNKLRKQAGEINDERLVRRLKVAGPDGLQRKMNAAKEMGARGSNTRFMALAIESAYLSGGRS